jgi:hypothetical protein
MTGAAFDPARLSRSALLPVDKPDAVIAPLQPASAA